MSRLAQPPGELRVGDPVAVDLIVTGQGNFDSLSSPLPAESEGWKQYPSKVVQEYRGTGLEPGSQMWNQVIVPQQPASEIPAFALSFFDPATGTYQTVVSPPLPVRVLPAEEKPAVVAAEAPAQDFSVVDAALPEEQLNDILTLRPASSPWVSLQWAPSGPGLWWAAQAVPAAALLAIIGICFKLAAVPMHFYAPDVYEGASSPVAAFISFVPKVQGFVTLALLLGTVGWGVDGTGALPSTVTAVLWMIAVLTMTLGNIGALLQRSAKRMLAYSSVANSGYMLVGILAGPKVGLDATLLYLLTYGVANLATFGALAAIERNGQEVDSLDDLAGLRVRAPRVALALAIGALSLTGIPPLLGFWGKLDLFVASAQGGQKALLVIMALNSGVAAFYYLRLVALPFVQDPTPRTQGVTTVASLWPRVSTLVFAVGCIVLPASVSALKTESAGAASFTLPESDATKAAGEAETTAPAATGAQDGLNTVARAAVSS
jgi:hypothetical protein